MKTGYRARVLVATQISRDAIALAIELQRPRIEVVQVAPADLGHELAARRPDLVIYSEPDPAVELSGVPWVLLCPGGASIAVINVDGVPRTTTAIQFAELLDALDVVTSAARAAKDRDDGGTRLVENPPFGGGPDAAPPLL